MIVIKNPDGFTASFTISSVMDCGHHIISFRDGLFHFDSFDEKYGTVFKTENEHETFCCSHLDEMIHHENRLLVSDMLLHNWLNTGNVVRRKQAFMQYGRLIEAVFEKLSSRIYKQEKREYLAEIVTADGGHPMSSVVNKIGNSGFEKSQGWVDVASAISPYDDTLLDNSIGHLIDSGMSPVDVLASWAKFEKWLVRGLHNDSPSIKDSKGQAVRLKGIFRSCYTLNQYGNADFMRTLNARTVKSLSDLSFVEEYLKNNGLERFFKYIKLAKILDKNEMYLRHKCIEIRDCLSDFTRFKNQTGINISDEFHQSLETFSKLCKLSDAWHRKVAPYAECQYYYKWEYNMPDTVIEIRGDSFLCKPIRSTLDLVNEGIEMKHCVSSRNDKCANGTSVVFSITGPERTTLEIDMNEGYVGEIVEQRTAYNGLCSVQSVMVAKKLSDMITGNPALVVVRSCELLTNRGQNINSVRSDFWNHHISKYVKC